MAKQLSSTELERAKNEFGDTAIEYQGDQPFLKSGFALGPLADPATPPQPEQTGSLSTPPPNTGTQTALNQQLQNMLNNGIFTSDTGREQIFDTQGRIKTAKEQSELQRQELERRRKQQVARIEDVFGSRERETRQTQEQQRGTEDALQFRLGLGGTPYAAEETRIKEAQRQAQLDDLASEKAYLIQQAENAYTDADFKLASQLTDQIQGIEDKEREIDRQGRQDEIQNYQLLLQGLQANRQQTEFEQEQASTQLENIISSGLSVDQVPDEQKQSIEQALGLPAGGFESYYQTYQQAQEAESVGDEIQLQQSLISLLQDIPPEQTITIGGKEYAGLQDETPNVLTYDKVVGNTKTKVAVDKGTGEVLWEQPMGQAYKYSGGGGTTPTGNNFIGDIEVADTTFNVIEGIQSVNDLTPSAQQQAYSDLRKLGFYSDTPPDWFKELAQETQQQSLSGAALRSLWEEERQPIINPPDEEDTENTKNTDETDNLADEDFVQYLKTGILPTR